MLQSIILFPYLAHTRPKYKLNINLLFLPNPFCHISSNGRVKQGSLWLEGLTPVGFLDLGHFLASKSTGQTHTLAVCGESPGQYLASYVAISMRSLGPVKSSCVLWIQPMTFMNSK